MDPSSERLMSRQLRSNREIAAYQNGIQFQRDTMVSCSVVASRNYQHHQSWFARTFLKGREGHGRNHGLFQWPRVSGWVLLDADSASGSGDRGFTEIYPRPSADNSNGKGLDRSQERLRKHLSRNMRISTAALLLFAIPTAQRQPNLTLNFSRAFG